jgi:3-hydroxy-3-methylglutaryl CoA synthase
MKKDNKLTHDLLLKYTAILDEKLSKKDTIIKLFTLTSGLDITAFSEEKKNAISARLLAMNKILGRYPIKTYDDYALFSETHLNELLKNIKQLCLIFCDLL